MTEVEFYDPLYRPESKLRYSVIAARHKGKWIFVRHNKRTTWEIAGGHIEQGETPWDAAGRELMEETGATRYDLECVATYSVTIDGVKDWGRLFYAEVHETGEIPDTSEIAEICLCEELPANLTHPDIQPFLFSTILKHRKII